MRKQIGLAIEKALDWTTFNSYRRAAHAPQTPNAETPPQETQEPQPACQNGVCDVEWKPGRRSIA